MIITIHIRNALIVIIMIILVSIIIINRSSSSSSSCCSSILAEQVRGGGGQAEVPAGVVRELEPKLLDLVDGVPVTPHMRN